jgi:hypothetical protein
MQYEKYHSKNDKQNWEVNLQPTFNTTHAVNTKRNINIVLA